MTHAFTEPLMKRSNTQCELCPSNAELSVLEIPPVVEPDPSKCVMACATCRDQVMRDAEIDGQHWKCLLETAWSQVPAVQVVAWRMLQRLSAETWAQDLADQIFLDEPTLEWAKDDPDDAEPTIDSNGTRLSNGDAVMIIKDLDVKGTGFVAKRGTIVKNIRLTSNPEHVDGRVNKTAIVLKTQFLKKTS